MNSLWVNYELFLLAVNISHIEQIHDVDRLDPNVLLDVQDLCSAGPTQETCATVDHTEVYGRHPATWARFRQEYICPERAT